MAIYDDEKEISAEDIKAREEDTEANSSGAGLSDDDSSSTGEGKEETSEKESLEDRFKRVGEGLKESDSGKEGGGFFRDDGRINKKSAGLGGILGKRKVLAGLGAGGLGLLVGGMFLFSFLNVFRLDHILNNIDARTFARFNATFDRRSDAWTRAYVKLRLGEIEGETGRDNNLFFRSNRVDTNSPVADWYRTLRSGNFEKKVFNDNGIYFTSMVGEDGIRAAKIEIRDSPDITFDVINKYPDVLGLDFTNLADVNSFLNTIDSGDLDAFINIEVFADDKSARKAIKNAVDNDTAWYRVIKRRHVRRDMANIAGVREWRFFEKTRDKLDNKKIAVQKKILKKVFSDNSNTGKFLGCLLTGDSCPRNSDSSSPDNKSGVTGATTGDALGDTDPTELSDTDNPEIPGESGNSTAQLVTDTASEAASEATEEATEAAIQQGPIKELIQKLATKFASGGPQKIWTVAKVITAIHTAFSGGEDSKIVALVKNARLSQLTAVYTTYSIARDQVKSGELTGEELGALYGTLDGFERSEGWQMVKDDRSASTVSAQSSSDLNLSKEAFCDPGNDKAIGQYAWLCDSEKPNSGGKAGAMAKAYDSTLGPIFAPIAAAVNGVRGIPLLSTLLDKIEGAVDGVTSSIISALGLDDDINKAMSGGLITALKFGGVGPMFDGSTAGGVNYIAGGGAGLAEASTRAGGGMASTKDTLRYTNQLASEYQTERYKNSSIFERYLAIDNQDSVASKSLFAITTTSPKKLVAKLASSITNLGWVTNIFSSSADAQTASSNIADWAGVEKYDIPQECIDMDPLTAGIYIGTNYETITRKRDLTWEIVRDTDAFYEKVYQWVGDDSASEAKAQAALSIYNCHLMDARIMGGLGYVSGYEEDHGYETSSTTSAGNTTTELATSTGFIGNPFETSVSVPCAEGTDDLGVQDAYYKGNLVRHKICGIPTLSSTSPPSQPGNAMYIDGANGHAMVNSRVSGAVLAMVAAAKSDGVNLTARSSFRSMAHQQALCANDSGCSSGSYALVAKPGTSNHQSGVAIDFIMRNVSDTSVRSCSNRARSVGDPSWDWLYANAEKFGYKQYRVESWHWDPDPESCDSSS